MNLQKKQAKIIEYLPGIKNYHPELNATNKGILLDAEATGSDEKVDTIIQLCMVPFTFTDDLVICELNDPIEMFNDPGGPIPEEITKLTGITDDMVAGKSLDFDVISENFKNIEIALAHQARFDRNILEKHVAIPDVVWGCTLYDIDWKAKFINSRTLDYIAFRNGFWYDGHDANEDTRALGHIMAIGEHEGKSYFSELMELAYSSTYKVILRDTEFSDNGLIKANKFRWNAENKYWYREHVKEDEFEPMRENFLTTLQKYSATKVHEDPLKRYKNV